MAIDRRQIQLLLDKALVQQLTPAELDQLLQWADDEQGGDELVALMEKQFESYSPANADDLEYWQERKEKLFSQLNRQRGQETVEIARSVHRVHFLRRGWMRYAAAVIFMVGIGVTIAVLSDKQPKNVVSTTVPDAEIIPGGDRATLTLADGSRIVLDSAANGQLADQGGAKVIKLEDGQLAYDPQSTQVVMYNTVSTPRGGQYQLTLPDGTNVWLNAASSITFPTAFIGNNRPVKISGEVYMEVKKDKSKAFIVDIEGRSTVEVLGTSFNINAYADEADIRTTLVEGSVKITRNNGNGEPELAILKPGQQATIDKNISISAEVDLERTLAWKNGYFSFKESDFKAVLRQLERWYDIKVELRGNYDDMLMEGMMDRGVQLSGIIRFFNSYGFETTLDGRTLIVTRK